MEMKTIHFTVTEAMQPYVVQTDKSTETKQRALLLYPYIHDQIISHGRAAELLGISKWSLIQLYGGMGIPYIDFDENELQEEIENSAFISSKHRKERA